MQRRKPAIATLAEHAAPGATAVQSACRSTPRADGYLCSAGQEYLQDHFRARKHVSAHAAAVEQRPECRVQPLISQTYKFSDSVAAFERAAADMPRTSKSCWKWSDPMALYAGIDCGTQGTKCIDCRRHTGVILGGQRPHRLIKPVMAGANKRPTGGLGVGLRFASRD